MVIWRIPYSLLSKEVAVLHLDSQDNPNELEHFDSEAGVFWSPVKNELVPWIDFKWLNETFLKEGGGGVGEWVLDRAPNPVV